MESWTTQDVDRECRRLLEYCQGFLVAMREASVHHRLSFVKVGTECGLLRACFFCVDQDVSVVRVTFGTFRRTLCTLLRRLLSLHSHSLPPGQTPIRMMMRGRLREFGQVQPAVMRDAPPTAQQCCAVTLTSHIFQIYLRLLQMEDWHVDSDHDEV